MLSYHGFRSKPDLMMLSAFHTHNDMAFLAATLAHVMTVIKQQIGMFNVKIEQIIDAIPAILAVGVFFHIFVGKHIHPTNSVNNPRSSSISCFSTFSAVVSLSLSFSEIYSAVFLSPAETDEKASERSAQPRV